MMKTPSVLILNMLFRTLGTKNYFQFSNDPEFVSIIERVTNIFIQLCIVSSFIYLKDLSKAVIAHPSFTGFIDFLGTYHFKKDGLFILIFLLIVLSNLSGYFDDNKSRKTFRYGKDFDFYVLANLPFTIGLLIIIFLVNQRLIDLKNISFSLEYLKYYVILYYLCLFLPIAYFPRCFILLKERIYMSKRFLITDFINNIKNLNFWVNCTLKLFLIEIFYSSIDSINQLNKDESLGTLTTQNLLYTIFFMILIIQNLFLNAFKQPQYKNMNELIKRLTILPLYYIINLLFI